MYFFVPKTGEYISEYEKALRLNEVFRVFSGGFITARDHFVIDMDKRTLVSRIDDFIDPSISDSTIRATYFSGCGADQYPDGDTRSWKLPEARQFVRKDTERLDHVQRCLYRPFDQRWIYWSDDMIDWPRSEVNEHLLHKNNLGLIFMRQAASGDGYSHFLITRVPTDNRACYSNKGIMTLAPLYLYPRKERKTSGLDFAEDRTGKASNFTDNFLSSVTNALGQNSKDITPDQLLNYAYGLFNSPTYRHRYLEFLRTDFPRLPITNHFTCFLRICDLGEELIRLHLLEADLLENLLPEPMDPNGLPVTKASFSNGTIWLDKSKTAGFREVPEAVWLFQMGGYQVCDNWLKDRRARRLTKADVTHFRKMITAISETIRIMPQIDEVIEEHGGWPDAFA